MDNPNLFGRDDQVTVVNPTNSDFYFMWDSKKYKMPPSQNIALPGYMAEQYVKTMTDAMMQRDGVGDKLTNRLAREPYYKNLVISRVEIKSLNADSPVNDNEIVDLSTNAVPNTRPAAPAAALASVPNTTSTATPAKEEKQHKDELPEDPNDSAIDEPIDLDDLPPEDELSPGDVPTPPKTEKAFAGSDVGKKSNK